MAILQLPDDTLIYILVGVLVFILFIVFLIAIRKLREKAPPKELPGVREIKKDLEDKQMIDLIAKDPLPKVSLYPTDYDPTKDPRVVELISSIQKDIKSLKKPEPENNASFADKLKDLINYELANQNEDSFNEAQIYMELEAAKYRLVKRQYG